MVDLRSSHISEELSNVSTDMEEVPVLIGKNVWSVPKISGGYDTEDDVYVIDLIIPLQSPGTTAPETFANNIEIHTNASVWNLDVERSTEIDGKDYILRLYVNDYNRYDYTFAEKLTMDIDKRETRYSPDSV